MESRTQGSRTRTQINFEAKAKDRSCRGQGQGPRTQTQVFKKKKRSSKFFFRRSQKKDLQKLFQAKNVFKNFFSGNLYLRKPKKRSLQIFRMVSGVFQRNFNGSKIVLSSSRGQGNFRGLEASRPRTSKCVLENVIEAKDVLKDSTSGNQFNHRSFNPRFGYHGALYFAFACLSSRYSETSTYNENCFSSFNFYQRTIANV